MLSDLRQYSLQEGCGFVTLPVSQPVRLEIYVSQCLSWQGSLSKESRPTEIALYVVRSRLHTLERPKTHQASIGLMSRVSYRFVQWDPVPDWIVRVNSVLPCLPPPPNIGKIFSSIRSSPHRLCWIRSGRPSSTSFEIPDFNRGFFPDLRS